ncbi:MAG: outer membrane protein assembly factor BamD [Bacteroidales bacterium]|nr:outer membrane protein assembly factor BamD [Bacteroidales bacterium]
MFNRAGIVFFTLLLALLSGSCSKYQRLLKSGDNEKKLEMANEYFAREDYYRALSLYEQLLPVYRATEQAEQIYYNYAYAYFNQMDYVLASYYFKKFYKTFPRSKWAEECFFMSGFCKYKESPVYSLDQTNTYEAINELQLFANTFPSSERVEECNTLIDELREKLEKKSYEIAKLYLKMDRFEAAVTAFNNVIKDYPDTRFKEDVMFYIVSANYQYSQKSVPAKKEERFQKTVKSCLNFVASYPESKYSKEVNNMYETSLKVIKNKKEDYGL